MRNWSGEEWWVVLLLLVVVGVFSFVVWDRCSGTTKLVMGTVYDKEYRHEVHTERHTDSKGRLTTSTHTHDYYWVKYRRDDGLSDRCDVGCWHYNEYFHSQRIVVRLTVGGVSGCEYLCGIAPFAGAEKS